MGSSEIPIGTEVNETTRAHIRSWLRATSTWRDEVRKDYNYVDGKQWDDKDRAKVESRGRPALTFNKILPQVALMGGIERNRRTNLIALPTKGGSIRLSEVASATLRAVENTSRMRRINSRVFDDSTICGLGVWEVVHSLEDADDLIWGDVVVSRIPPLAFVFDPWAVLPTLQDGEFMGKGEWVSQDRLEREHPKFKRLANPGEWLSEHDFNTGDPERLGIGRNLVNELWDQETGRVRVLTIWEKHPVKINLLADLRTGQVIEVRSESAGRDLLNKMKNLVSKQSLDAFRIETSEEEVAILGPDGTPLVDPQTQRPFMFLSAEDAQKFLDDRSKEIGIEFLERFSVISRKAMKPSWKKLVWWQEIDSGETPNDDRDYPFIPYISSKYQDDPESMQGIVRGVRDSQDEYNKRYSQLLAHLNSGAHSGWLNKKGVGADTSSLELMGARPGIVVEYGAVKPDKIEPSALPQGHFALLPTSEANVRTTTGLNNEVVGDTTQKTVSGRAIRARQQGGLTIAEPRLRSYEDAKIDLGKMSLSRVRQFFPVDKIRLIIDLAEMEQGLGPDGRPLFEGQSDEQVIQELTQLKNTDFHFVVNTRPEAATERQAKFEVAIEMAQLVTSTGRPLGQATLNELVEMSDMPSNFARALQQDFGQPIAPTEEQVNQTGNQLKQVIDKARGGRAGGDER